MDINFHVDFSNDARSALFLDVIHACNLRQTVTDHKKHGRPLELVIDRPAESNHWCVLAQT